MSTAPASLLLEPLARWFNQHRRSMPWRAENLDAPHPNPYAVLVSEVMLQQTQVATVIPYFERWMQRFPSLESLAMAEQQDVLNHWAGLGYYHRARNLHAAAKAIQIEGWPHGIEGLQALAGLGPYTSAALAAIAFQWPEPALDGNAFRVLARLLALEGDPKTHARQLRIWLRPALETLGASRLTQALMELGATYCGRRAQCQDCPLHAACEARRQQRTQSLPVVVARPKAVEVPLWLLAIEAQAHWYLLPPANQGLLSGLWRWPALEGSFSTSATTPSPLPLRQWKGWTQVYTHRRELVQPLAIALPEPWTWPGGRWVPDQELAHLPMGRRDQRLRSLLGTPSLQSVSRAPLEALLTALSEGGAPHGA